MSSIVEPARFRRKSQLRLLICSILLLACSDAQEFHEDVDPDDLELDCLSSECEERDDSQVLLQVDLHRESRRLEAAAQIIAREIVAAALRENISKHRTNISSGRATILDNRSNVSEAKATAAVNSSAAVKAPPGAGSSSEAKKDVPPNIMIIMLVMVILAVVAYVLVEIIGKRIIQQRRWESEERKNLWMNGIDLFGCFLGILIFFCSYGIAQEYIMTQMYGDEKFPSVTFIILVNRVMLIVVATINILAKREGLNFPVAKWTVIPSATVLISSFSQYESLHYVTFPTQVVFKSAKIVPTMLLNMIVNRESAKPSEYLTALVITGAVIGFSMIAEGQKEGDVTNSTASGVLLLCLFLLCDALTSNTEKWVYNKDKTFTNAQMMFAMGIVCFVYSAIATAFVDGGYPRVFGFLSRHPESIIQIVMLSICSTFGQWVIYYTVRMHGPVSLAVMMTVRQIISVYISAILYHHFISPVAALCAAIAFIACLWKPFWKWYSPAENSDLAKKKPLASNENKHGSQ